MHAAASCGTCGCKLWPMQLPAVAYAAASCWSCCCQLYCMQLQAVVQLLQAAEPAAASCRACCCKLRSLLLQAVAYAAAEGPHLVVNIPAVLLASCAAGKAGHHNVHRTIESCLAQGVQVCDVTKHNVGACKLLRCQRQKESWDRSQLHMSAASRSDAGSPGL